MNQNFRLLRINNASRVLTVARSAYWYNLCPHYLHNTSQVAPFTYTSDTVTDNLTLYYGCPSISSIIPGSMTESSQFTCTTNQSSIVGYVLSRKVRDLTSANLTSIEDYFGACNTSVIIPVNQSAIEDIRANTTLDALKAAINQGFGLQWADDDGLCRKCLKSGGQMQMQWVRIPVNQSAIQTIDNNTTIDTREAAINQGFGLQWVDDGSCKNCVESGGQCGQDKNNGKFACHCPKMTYLTTCPGRKPKRNREVLTAILVALGASVAIVITSIFCTGVNFSLWKTKLFRKEGKQNDYDADEFMRNNGPLAPRRYKYADVKKMTDSFSEKLGRGGYGEVYKGKLKDGPLIAVKVIRESKANGGEFLNEVVSISRTCHVNIVALLGFCYQGNKRALVYEYMPNGSLDKFLPSQGGSSTTFPLEWKISYQIAMGIAQGLEYLHRGCSTRILHLDIKPQNILLDQDFTPKISDFGLAKLCKGKESIVSMLGTRGTCGYIAPEVMSRNFGGGSHKSDVYSFGMLVLEMIGGRNNSNDQAPDGSEVYFADMVYRHLDPDEGLKLDGITTEVEEEIVRKMIIVSIWCIQANPSDRPSITKAIEMLEGSLELLPIPPKPSLPSPSVSLGNFEITSSSSTFTNSKSHQGQEPRGGKPVATCIRGKRPSTVISARKI